MTFGQADEFVPRARRLAERALALDPDLAEAHAMLGTLAAIYKPDFQEAERRFRRALEREPVPWHVRSWYSNFFLQTLGRHEEARREGERALEDNPLSQILHWCLGNVLSGSGLAAAAEAAWAKAADLDAHFWLASTSLCLHHTALGRAAEARTSAERAFSISPNPFCTAVLAGALRNAESKMRRRRFSIGFLTARNASQSGWRSSASLPVTSTVQSRWRDRPWMRAIR
jgi:tetratricopeptide (TPR) repeat protein